MTISFSSSFSTSANGCSRPPGPTRFGPMRACIEPITRRSASVRNAIAQNHADEQHQRDHAVEDHGLHPFRQERQQLLDELRHAAHEPCRPRASLVACRALERRTNASTDRSARPRRHARRPAGELRLQRARRRFHVTPAPRSSCLRTSSVIWSDSCTRSPAGSAVAEHAQHLPRRPRLADGVAAPGTLCQRPSRLTYVPAVSANVPIGRITSREFGSAVRRQRDDELRCFSASSAAGDAMSSAARSHRTGRSLQSRSEHVGDVQPGGGADCRPPRPGRQPGEAAPTALPPSGK